MTRLETKKVSIYEFAKESSSEGDKLSLLDIKAAIAEQAIPISELYSKQDLASSREVMELIHETETKVKAKLEKEIVILNQQNKELKTFKDKVEVVSLVEKSKALADKPARISDYIRARLKTGRGVDLTGDLTNEQRQDKVNEAVEEELKLIEEQGITFKDPTKKEDKVFFEDDADKDEVDMTNPEFNPLIPSEKEKEK